MRGRQAWAAAAIGIALAIGAASFPWSQDAEGVAKGLDVIVAPYGYHWERPSSATLRLFPEPILDVFGMRLADASGKLIFNASTGAFQLSALDWLAGRYVLVRARLKDPSGDLDLDALSSALPGLVASPPVAALQFRGGRVRVWSRRLGIDQTLSPFSGSLNWLGPDRPLRLTLGGVWNGRWGDLETTVDQPAKFVTGAASDVKFGLTTAGATVTLDGAASFGSGPSFDGKVLLSTDSLASAAAWAGFGHSGLPDAAAGASGALSISRGQISFEDGQLSFKGQNFEGSAALQSGAEGWMASATLAAEKLDLAALIGPVPTTRDSEGWSHTPFQFPWPQIGLDLRFSIATAVWGAVSLADAAVSVSQRGGETHVRILDGSYADGSVAGDVIVRDCAIRCSWRATLSLVNAEAAAVTGAFGKSVANGVCAIDVDLSASGDSPAQLISSLDGEVGVTVRDGALLGINFEEALRRSKRRAIDIARDLVVGETSFRKLETKFSLAHGVAEFRGAKLTGPGVFVTGAGELDLPAQSSQISIEARQADALGHVSSDGATLDLTLQGPWRSPGLAAQTPAN
jgi:uncharacterized protein involved in outer membrane biogenesis